MKLHAPLRQRLAQDANVAQFAGMEKKYDIDEVADRQELGIATRVYEHLWPIYENCPDDAVLFPVSPRNGRPYFEPIHRSLLRMIGDRNVSGAKKLTPFKDYHDPEGSDIIKAIVNEVDDGTTVLLDLANADPVVANYYSEMIAKEVFARQMTKFSEMDKVHFDKHSVLFYFEEAHNLFRADDRDLRSIYNKLAKEGGKFRIGMVYATQSMTTLTDSSRLN